MYQLIQGDCLDVMAGMADNSVTAIVTDPPYGLGETPDIAELMQQWITEGRADMGKGFMGRNWDVVPGPVYWREMFRIAKPGAYLLAMCGTRTVDLMSIAIRFGGWVKFDEISYHMGQGLPNLIDWTYGAGFPKSMAIDKAIDKHLGKTDEREVVGSKLGRPGMAKDGRNQSFDSSINTYGTGGVLSTDITAPATPEAAQWQNYGTSLKPAHEIILCFRKPVDKTYANNALVHGCGGLNIDGCRISHDEPAGKPTEGMAGKRAGIMGETVYRYRENTGPATQGRWPPNLIWDGSDAIKAEFDKAGERRSAGNYPTTYVTKDNNKIYGKGVGNTQGELYSDSGSAARFFPVCPPDVPRLVYHSKASSGERNEGLDGMDKQQKYAKDGRGNSHEIFTSDSANDDAWAKKNPNLPQENFHPTVKPLSLLRWMVKLVRQPTADLIIDPFGGSGTTGVAALLEGCDTIIIEREADYIPIIRARLEHFESEVSMTPVVTKGKPTDTDNLPLFA